MRSREVSRHCPFGCSSFSILKGATSVANRSLVGSAAGWPSITFDGIPIGVRPSGLAAGLPPSAGTISSWTFGLFVCLLLTWFRVARCNVAFSTSCRGLVAGAIRFHAGQAG